MAIDRTCGDIGHSVTHWLDRHPVFSEALVVIGTTLVVVVVAIGAVALLVLAAQADSS